MFLTKKYLSRRTMLRGLGVSVALPLLDSMIPAQTPLAKTAAVGKSRLACIEIVHGAAGSTAEGSDKHYWTPEKEGSDFEFTESLQPLEQLREYLTIISRTDLWPAMAWTSQESGGDHFRSSAAFLTACHPKMTEGADIYCGTSIDQIYAQQFGQDTPLPSMQLCIEGVDESGACDFGYSCVYSGSISWASPTSPLPMERDPRQVFESLFGEGGTSAQRAARLKEKGSILDVITRQVARLQKGLPSADRHRLGSYLEDVREIERRIQKIEQYNASNTERELPTAPLGVPDSFEDHINLMFDLQVLAFQAGMTRVSSFKLSRDVCMRLYPESGVKTPFHVLSHHGETGAKLAEFAKLNRYHVSKLGYFLDKLKSTPDGDGNLLDHSLVLYGSPMGDSNVHNHKRVPLLLAGHANGTLKGNLNVITPDETPLANALLSVLHKLGVPADRVGDSIGEISI
jgi:hypothetical protein